MPDPFRVSVPVRAGAVVWQYTPGASDLPPRLTPAKLLVPGHGCAAALVYAAVRFVLALSATASALCWTPDLPGGNPVTALPGETPSWPVIHVGPVLVTVVPARTAKL